MAKLDLMRMINKKEMKVSALYTYLTSTLGVQMTISELKSLNVFLMAKKNEDKDEDVDFMNVDESVMDLQLLAQQLPIDQNQEIHRLNIEIRRLKSMNMEDLELQNSKNVQMKRELLQYQNQNQDLSTKVNKLEAQKNRLEQVFKTTMKGGNMDLIDEVQMLVRRIEFLEEQSQSRNKNNFMESQEPYLREIEMLKSKLMQERDMRDQIIQKKNAEVSYFKAELDALLSEMQNQFTKKKSSKIN